VPPDMPEGNWFDFFTGLRYASRKGRKMQLHRNLKTIPVLAKAGAIVPMARYEKHDNRLLNSRNMEVLVFPGSSNTFELYEDAGDYSEYQKGAFARTNMTLTWGETACFVIAPAVGELSLIPEERNWSIKLRGFHETVEVSTLVNGREVAAQISREGNTTCVTVAAAATDKHTFFGGGMTNYNAFQKVVDVYDEVFTRTTLNLSVQRGMLGGAAVGNKALFAGGHYYPGSNIYNTYSSVDMIDESLTLSTATALAASANRMASISTGDFALFMGGEYTYYNTGLESRTETPRSNVNAYDESLTRTNLTALAVARRSPAVAMIDKYIVAAGGSRESGAGSEDITNYANVDVYQIE